MRKFLLLFLVLMPTVLLAKEPSYKKILKTFTREDKVYRSSDMSAVIMWGATLLNDEMLNAQASLYAKKYDLSDSEKLSVLDELKKKTEGKLLFFVSFYSSHRNYDDLKNPKAYWDLRLEINGLQFRPVKMEKMGKPTPRDILFFPYMNYWGQGYYVWFDVSPSSEHHVLKIFGTDSHSTLTWP